MGLFDIFKKSVSAKDQASTTTQKSNATNASRNANTDQSGGVITPASRDPSYITHKLLFVGTAADWSQVIDRDLHRLQQTCGFRFVPDAAQAIAAFHEEFYAIVVHASVAWHHHPTHSQNKGFTLLTAVHAANVFAYELGCGGGMVGLSETFDHPYLLQIGLGDNRNNWRRACNVPQRIEEDAEHAKFRMRRDAKVK